MDIDLKQLERDAQYKIGLQGQIDESRTLSEIEKELKTKL